MGTTVYAFSGGEIDGRHNTRSHAASERVHCSQVMHHGNVAAELNDTACRCIMFYAVIFNNQIIVFFDGNIVETQLFDNLLTPFNLKSQTITSFTRAIYQKILRVRKCRHHRQRFSSEHIFMSDYSRWAELMIVRRLTE